jgi:tetratricopeptide (TPR) repeat protein
MTVFIYGWGKVKIKIAQNRFAKGKKHIAEKDYRGAVKQLEDLSSELKNDPDYWFYLGLALVGAGSKADAKQVLLKTLEIDDSHIKARELLDKIGE